MTWFALLSELGIFPVQFEWRLRAAALRRGERAAARAKRAILQTAQRRCTLEACFSSFASKAAHHGALANQNQERADARRREEF